MCKPGWRDSCRLLLWEDSWQPTAGVRGIWALSRPRSCCSLLRGRGATWATFLSLHRYAFTSPMHLYMLHLHLHWCSTIQQVVFCNTAVVSCCSILSPAGPHLTLHDVILSEMGFTKLIWPRRLGRSLRSFLLCPCQGNGRPGHSRSCLAEICPVRLGPHQHMLLLVCRLPEQDLIQAAALGCVHLMLGQDV